jgi:Fur family ferric uptake transcriptional regulator
MPVTRDDHVSDATRLRQRGLRVTGPRLAILATLEEVGGHRAVDELVLALRRSGYHHARTTVYNALDDLARAGLVRAAPVDAGALRYESAGPAHHHFVCRRCGVIRNVPIASDLEARPLPDVAGGDIDELDVVYRGFCSACAEAIRQERTSASLNGERTSEGQPAPQVDLTSAEGRTSEGRTSEGRTSEGRPVRNGEVPATGRLAAAPASDHPDHRDHDHHAMRAVGGN